MSAHFFAFSVESREAGRALDMTESAERAASLLSRFFRITDIVGYLGENRFAAFLTGNLTGSVVWEKAATLSEALWFANEQTPAESIESYVGVYVFRAYDDVFKAIFRKADYALEMAHKDANRRFYIYTMPGTEPTFFRAASESFSSQMLRSYIDEGVRLIEVGKGQKAVYISPGYYRRLALDGRRRRAAADHASTPPMPRLTSATCAEAAETGQPVESRYRVSRDGAAWIPCRLRLVAHRRGGGGARWCWKISHNISGLEELKSQYDEKREWLRFLAAETDYQLWEVDVKARTFRLLVYEKPPRWAPDGLWQFPRIADREWPRPSRQRRALPRLCARNCSPARARAAATSSSSTARRAATAGRSMSYHMLYDEEGRPEKAIGIKEDLSYMPAQQRSVQRRVMPADLYPHLYCYLQADITTDTVEKLQMEGRERVELIALPDLHAGGTQAASPASFPPRTARALPRSSAASACWRNLPGAAAGSTSSARSWIWKAPSSGSPWASTSARTRRAATSASLPT